MLIQKPRSERDIYCDGVVKNYFSKVCYKPKRRAG